MATPPPPFGMGTTATSGTAGFNPDIVEIYEIVSERAGLDADVGSDGTGAYNLRQFRRDYNLLSQEMSNRGLNLGTLETGTIVLVPGQSYYFFPPDTLDILDGFIRVNAGVQYSQNDVTITRQSLAQYSSIPNKLTTGKPLNFTVQRQTSTISMIVWPIPDAMQTYTFYYTRLRRVQDAGRFTNNIDYPYRALPVIVAGLTFYMALRKPALVMRVPMLKDLFEEQFKHYQSADSDRATFRMVPASNLD